MKNLIKIILMILIVISVYFYKDNICDFILDNIIYRGNNRILNYNEYYINNDYLFVQNTDSNEVNSYQELLNILYSIINSGDESYTFNCKYDECSKDVDKLISDNTMLSNINNFVHPYNSFKIISIDVNNIGTVNVSIEKMYNDNEIIEINDYINNFINQNINDTMYDYDKIKSFHDYIINNTIYNTNDNNYNSNAYTLIKEGTSICVGYSDIMSIYLNKLGIKNYKIMSDKHVWNLLFLDNKWYHIDATWDDPIASDGNQYLLYSFFMITTDELLTLDKVEHNFDKSVYIEAN